MRYFKITSGGYIVVIGENGQNGEPISENEYNAIQSAIKSAPVPVSGMSYRLREDLTWEAYEVDSESAPEEELTAEETISIILGNT